MNLWTRSSLSLLLCFVALSALAQTPDRFRSFRAADDVFVVAESEKAVELVLGAIEDEYVVLPDGSANRSVHVANHAWLATLTRSGAAGWELGAPTGPLRPDATLKARVKAAGRVGQVYGCPGTAESRRGLIGSFYSRGVSGVVEACGDTLTVVDDVGRIACEVPKPAGFDARARSVAYDPVSRQALVFDEDRVSRFLVIDCTKQSTHVIEWAPTNFRPAPMALAIAKQACRGPDGWMVMFNYDYFRLDSPGTFDHADLLVAHVDAQLAERVGLADRNEPAAEQRLLCTAGLLVGAYSDGGEQVVYAAELWRKGRGGLPAADPIHAPMWRLAFVPQQTTDGFSPGLKVERLAPDEPISKPAPHVEEAPGPKDTCEAIAAKGQRGRHVPYTEEGRRVVATADVRLHDAPAEKCRRGKDRVVTQAFRVSAYTAYNGFLSVRVRNPDGDEWVGWLPESALVRDSDNGL